ncbi:hypothetical protein B0H63DRAFT_524993 [Podospora didyma]|uniref:Uncharacterized protein n=1 Tax=Podospora didyma TaxID=330526 RepID=A0AAE0KJM0_9PEZI|nr:hypothetical protein B0H63DRAFT_524993 [Podospora didyma]
MVKNIQTIYRDSMRRHRFGYALYEPVPFERLRPGMLGHLDEYQRWHPILDLTDATAVEAAGYTAVGYLQSNGPDTRRWGPLAASDVSASSVELEAGAGAAVLGLPVDLGGALSFSTAGGAGAVLMCDDDVVSEGFDFRDPFLVWLKQNARLLFAKYPDLKKHGVCVATWTYSSEDIHISVWESGEHSVAVGFNVGVPGTGEAGPRTSWFRGHASSGWSAWTGQKRVVFFTGVKVRVGILGGTKEQREKDWRGGDQTFIVEDDKHGNDYKAEAELFGDDWYDISDD